MTGLDRRGFLGALGAGVAGTVLASACSGPTHPPPPTAAPTPVAAPRPLFVGTYTDGDGAGKGIGLGTWDPDSGELALDGTATVANPSFLAIAPGGHVLYAVDEQDQGMVSALTLTGDTLTMINSRSSEGAGPTHLCVHPSGRYVLAANYDSGSAVVLPVDAHGGLEPASDLAQHTGSGPDHERQDAPHVHQVLPDPSGQYLHAVDLGTDSIYAYQLDLVTGKLALRKQAKLRAGSGPRHLAFHPSGRFAYVATELGASVITCGYADGLLTPLREQPTIPTPPTGVANAPAEVLVSADGRFVYVSNRGTDTIGVFAVGPDGQLKLVTTPACGGKTPRHIGLDPTGRYLFCSNQDSNNVTTFAVDKTTGGLTAAAKPLLTPSPVCTLSL
jgi:6-phosphogluconolactonase